MLVTLGALRFFLRTRAINAVAGTEINIPLSTENMMYIATKESGSDKTVYSTSFSKNQDVSKASSSITKVTAKPESNTATNRSTMRQSLHG